MHTQLGHCLIKFPLFAKKYCLRYLSKMNKQPALLCEKDVNIQNLNGKKFNFEPVKFRVRNLKKKDLPQVLAIYRETDWHISPYSIQMWHEVDPNSVKVAVTDNGIILGFCCAVRLHQNFCFVGFYTVRKACRGMGVGKKVWDVCMEHIGWRNAALNGVPDKVSMYQTKGGFPILEEELQVQENDTLDDIIHPENLMDNLPDDVIIVPYHASYLPFILDYDYEICGFNRELALELSFKAKESKTLVAFKDGMCVGFGTIKRSILNVPMIGPLYADDSAVAESMMKRLMMSYPLKKGLYLASFTQNKSATNLIKKIGCPTSYKLPRLTRSKHNFQVPVNKVYAHFDLNASPV